MKTKSISLFAALALTLCVATVQAQNGGQGYPTSEAVQPYDYSKMPFSLKLPIVAPAPWSTTTEMWLTAIWPRNASGSWYRNPATPNEGRPASAYVTYSPNLQSSSWTCFAEAGLRFRCRDNVRGLDRFYTCPSTVNFGAPKQWRSLYNEWPNSQQGWFWWRPEAAATWYVNLDSRNWLKPVANFVTKPEFQNPILNCQYAWPAVVDVWAGFYVWPR